MPKYGITRKSEAYMYFQLKRRVNKIFGFNISSKHTKKEHPSGALSYARQRPTLTGGQPPTTIGAEKL
ncbi:hypothetical protein, partial [Cytobacillus firmus]|uniref:hypothetical protein n=1 Tax=Cytobacillus firmus TaxID=1399 RepID=UPI001C693EB5